MRAIAPPLRGTPYPQGRRAPVGPWGSTIRPNHAAVRGCDAYALRVTRSSASRDAPRGRCSQIVRAVRQDIWTPADPAICRSPHATSGCGVMRVIGPEGCLRVPVSVATVNWQPHGWSGDSARKRRCATGTDSVWPRPYRGTASEAWNSSPFSLCAYANCCVPGLKPFWLNYRPHHGLGP